MYDPITMDPPTVDTTHPSLRDLVRIESGGDHFNARLYVASGPGPHPTVVLWHGYPGVTDLTYLAQILQRAGYNTLYPHVRGTWGSGGDFSWSNALADVKAAVEWLRAPEGQERFRVDPEQIALAGHSFGGWLALVCAAEDADVVCVAALMPANFGVLAQAAQKEPEVWRGMAATLGASVDETSGPVRGTSGEALIIELMEQDGGGGLIDNALAVYKVTPFPNLLKRRSGPPSVRIGRLQPDRHILSGLQRP